MGQHTINEASAGPGAQGAQGAQGATGAQGTTGNTGTASDALVLLYPLSSNVNRDSANNATTHGLFPFGGGNPRINNTSGSGVTLTNSNQTLTAVDGVFNVKASFTFKRTNTGNTLLGTEIVAKITATTSAASLYLRDMIEVPVGEFLDNTTHHLDFYIVGIPSVVSESVLISFGTLVDSAHADVANSGIRLVAGSSQITVTKVAEAPGTYTPFSGNAGDTEMYSSNEFALDSGVA